MFKKALLVSDQDGINTNLIAILEGLGISCIITSPNGDDALLRTKRSLHNGEPFDLLITDLSLRTNQQETRLDTAARFIEDIRKEINHLAIIVYLKSNEVQQLRPLMVQSSVNAFVVEDPRNQMELNKAIRLVHDGQKYISSQLKSALNSINQLEIDDYDIALLKQLSLGLSKDQISDMFKENRISPNSISSIEKRQNKLFIQFRATNATHLIAIVKDMGLI